MGVQGAARGMTAYSRQVGGHSHLIEPYRGQRQAPHHFAFDLSKGRRAEVGSRFARLKRAVIERLSLWKSAVAAGFRAMRTESHPGRMGALRAPSLSLRFTLFRTTEFPTRRPTENPKRLNARPFCRVTRTSTPFDQLLPPRRTALKSFAVVSLSSLFISRGAHAKKDLWG